MPDQRSWRIDPAADYGPLNTAARGRIDLDRVRRHWQDILRVIASIYTLRTDLQELAHPRLYR
jgi:TnpA family transposase